MNKLVYILLFFIIGGNVHAQGTSEPKYVREANILFESGKYFDAIENLSSALEKVEKKNNIDLKQELTFKLAESYRLIANYEDALDRYKQCQLYDLKNPDLNFFIAECHRMMNEYDEAREKYDEFLKDPSRNRQRDKDVEMAFKAMELYDNHDEVNEFDFDNKKRTYDVEYQEDINLSAYDMSVSVANKKGNTIYFASSREDSFGSERDPITGEKYMDIYEVSFEKDNTVSPPGPKRLESDVVNTSQNESSVCFDKKFKTMYFTRCPKADVKEYGCEIWKVDIVDGEFTNEEQMNLTIDPSFSVGHPCLTPDDKMLIFASDIKSSGGDKSFGGRDLWYVTYDKKSKSWDSIPKNLGPEYNTSGNELFPSIGKSGKFFFASDGRKGLGGLDIFYCDPVKDQENRWGKPINMGYPINSTSNDYDIAEWDSKGEIYGFFTSERRRKDGEYKPNIYRYSLPPILFTLKVQVLDFDTKEPIEEAIVTVYPYDSIKGNIENQKFEGYTNDDGNTQTWAEKGNKRYINKDQQYVIVASKENYLAFSDRAMISTINLFEDQNFYMPISLVPIKPEKELRTPEVRYPLNQWTFINDETCMSKDSLLFLSDLLTNNPFITIDLFSHTDSRSSASYNQVLSENRAKAVYKFLVEEKGIDARRIQPIGKGEAEPATWIDENGQEVVLTERYINKFRSSDRAKFELLHQINRRTTVRITSQNFDSETAPEANPDWMEFKPLR